MSEVLNCFDEKVKVMFAFVMDKYEELKNLGMDRFNALKVALLINEGEDEVTAMTIVLTLIRFCIEEVEEAKKR